MPRRIGYGRLSVLDPDPDTQQAALAAAGCDPLYIDQAVTRRDPRPGLDTALSTAQRGDVLVVTHLIRLAWTTRELIDLALVLHARGIGLQVLEQDIDTSTPAGHAQVFVALDQFLRDLVSEGTHRGLTAGRARGRRGGRPPSITPEQITQARVMYDQTGPDGRRVHTVTEIATHLGVSRATIYRHLNPTKASVAGPAGAQDQPEEDPAS